MDYNYNYSNAYGDPLIAKLMHRVV